MTTNIKTDNGVMSLVMLYWAPIVLLLTVVFYGGRLVASVDDMQQEITKLATSHQVLTLRVAELNVKVENHGRPTSS